MRQPPRWTHALAPASSEHGHHEAVCSERPHSRCMRRSGGSVGAFSGSAHCLSMDIRYYALGSDSTGLLADRVSRQCEDEQGGRGFGSPGYIGFAMIVRIPELCASASVRPLYDSRMHEKVDRPRRAASSKACQSESRVAVPANDLQSTEECSQSVRWLLQLFQVIGNGEDIHNTGRYLWLLTTGTTQPT